MSMPFVLLEFDMSPYVDTCRALDEYIDGSRPLRTAAIIVRANIRTRATSGTSHKGRLPEYKPPYAKRKKKLGKQVSPPDYTLSGKLLRDLTISRDDTRSNEVYVSPAMGKDRLKAEGNAKKRPLMGVTEQDQAQAGKAIDLEIEQIAAGNKLPPLTSYDK
jgi:hypothetical protein